MDLAIPHFLDPAYDGRSSVLRPKHFPGSLRMLSEVPLFEKSGLLVRPRTEFARSSDGGGSLTHYAHTDIMRSSIFQPPDAADKL